MMDQKPERFPLLRRSAGPVLRWLRGSPWLLLAASLGGAAIWLVVSLRDAYALGRDTHIAQHVNFVVEEGGRLAVMHAFFERHWSLAAMLMLPAVLLAFLRLRGKDLLLTVTLVCSALYLLWLGNDLYHNLDHAFNNPLGMEATPAAYFWKLALMGFLMMSPPVLMWLYYRSSIMDRYLVRCFSVPFLLCLCGILGIMITMDLLNRANDFVMAKYGIGKVAFFYLTQLPQFLVMVTEAALLLATLYALGRMSRYNELISMQTAGRSVGRMLLPVFLFGGWCSFALVALNYQLAPEAERTKEEMLEAADRRSRAGEEKTVEFNVSYRNAEDHRTWLIYKLPFDLAEGNKMDGIWLIQQTPEGDLTSVMFAKSAMWSPHHRTWTFYSATIYDQIRPDAFPPCRKRVEDKLAIAESWRETPGSILSDRLNPEYLGVPELVSYLRTNQTAAPQGLARYETTMHWRFALPFRALLLVLIAAPLGIVSSRRGLLGGVTTAVGIFVCLYFLSTIFLKAGEGLYLPPSAGAWGVNIVFLLLGLALLWKRAGRHLLPRWRRDRTEVRPATA